MWINDELLVRCSLPTRRSFTRRLVGEGGSTISHLSLRLSFAISYLLSAIRFRPNAVATTGRQGPHDRAAGKTGAAARLYLQGGDGSAHDFAIRPIH